MSSTIQSVFRQFSRNGKLSQQNLSRFIRRCSTVNSEENSFKTMIKRLESKGLPIVHHHGYVCDLPVNHQFPMKKFHGVMHHLKVDNVISMRQVLEPERINIKNAQTVHTVEYTEKFFTGHTSREEQKVTGFDWSEGLVSRVRYETGGTLLAARAALERGMACSTGGGTHHAFPSHGSGYCLLNDLAITAAVLLKEGAVQKVLIVDLDVHQGDGTAYIFRNDERVFTFSMHCEKNFPTRKQKSDLDVPLEDRMQDREYLDHLQTHLPKILNDFHPDLVLYDAGVDPHVDDELGRLSLTDKGLFDRDYYVIDTVVSKGCPIATVIGGGYSRDLKILSARHTIVHRAATKPWKVSFKGWT
ncbi:hypothetical protein ACJMK2_030981 [Sinanodonta woodiana]|uniref:Histone deacetylase domain-containing protein n=1 Tax=Sinanodonta woodiana TaxID=1069815 RepID=A0ABD3X1D6_SINWO